MWPIAFLDFLHASRKEETTQDKETIDPEKATASHTRKEVIANDHQNSQTLYAIQASYMLSFHLATYLYLLFYYYKGNLSPIP